MWRVRAAQRRWELCIAMFAASPYQVESQLARQSLGLPDSQTVYQDSYLIVLVATEQQAGVTP